MNGRRDALAARMARALLWGLAAAHLLEAIWLRHRRRHIDVLKSPAPSTDGTGNPAEAVDVLALEGAVVDAETLAAAGREMETAGLEVIDLVPGDLPADRALRLLRRVDARELVENPLRTPGGAYEAIVAKRDLLRRMGANTRSDDRPECRRLTRGEMVRQTVGAQRYAPTTSTLRVAPGLRAGPCGPRDRWLELVEQTAWSKPIANLAPVAVGLETGHLVAMTAGLLVAPPAALAAVATWSLQPAIALGLRPTRAGEPAAPGATGPRGLPGECALRLPRTWVRNLCTAIAGYREARTAAPRRADGNLPVVPPTGDLFDERRHACPWCGASALAARLDTPDLRLHKPGRFHLDECTRCGHLFQNPALSAKGLDYYYEDFYAGAAHEAAEMVFAGMERTYHQRIETMARLTGPHAWLDVGTGYGHFCLAARQRWPEATFDGLDMGASVIEAERRGWIDTGHRGQFPDLAGSLPSYDVISMHHYLEHTRDPGLELVAASKVLERGGHLLVEVPDPESPWARRLGRYWINWCQPQHLHFISCHNLASALEDEGFEVVSVERGTATTGLDLTMAMFLRLNTAAPTPHVPWRPAPNFGDRAKRIGAIAATVPIVPLTLLADGIHDARLGPDDIGSAYRIVARKL